MSYMQYQPNMSLQTPEQKQMGIVSASVATFKCFDSVRRHYRADCHLADEKTKMPALDAHGKMVTNWLISSYYLYVRERHSDHCAYRVFRNSRRRRVGRRFPDYRRHQGE